MAQLGDMCSVCISSGFVSRICKYQTNKTDNTYIQVKWTMDVKAIHSRGNLEIGMANELRRCLVSFAGKCS